MHLTLREDKLLLQTDAGRALLAPSLYLPTEEKIRLKAEKYVADGAFRAFFALNNDVPLGICILQPGQEDAEIVSISVLPGRQHQGIGRALIAHVQNVLQQPLFAETDDDAVVFYEKCGFSIRSLGEKYPGIVRYHCILSKED